MSTTIKQLFVGIKVNENSQINNSLKSVENLVTTQTYTIPTTTLQDINVNSVSIDKGL